MPVATGTKLGPYEVVAPLGAGGMGEVYRARDSRLGREVALKILPDSFARDTERLHRFELEARAVAALNHPNILGLFDIGQHNGSPFLVGELLDGESLRAVLDSGPLPQRRAIEYGVQIAEGLAAAHEKGIVHRDLKPENLFVTRNGRIKILDFGVAKLAQKASAVAIEGKGATATATSSHTAPGVVMGTASYMAPEQVRGEAVDPRTDLFAMGAVLYEMLSGQRAFRRETTAETMTAVLKEDPPELAGSGRPISPALDRIVRRCLEKNPEQRFQSAKDLSFALSALSGPTDVREAIFSPRGAHWWRWALGALALVTAAAAAAIILVRQPPPVRMQFSIAVPGEVSHIALSRDGSILAFVAPDENSGLPTLYVQRIGSPQATALAATEGASYPFWSPDNAHVGFFANGKLQEVAVSGSAPQVLAKVLNARGGSWGTRNVIIYAPDAGGPIWRVNSDGTGAAPVTQGMLITQGTLPETTHRWPVFLPDGNHFLFWGGNFGNTPDDRVSGIYEGSLDGHERKLIVLCHSNPGYDSSHLFYANDKLQLVSVAFDAAKGSVSGETRTVASVVGYQPSTYWMVFAVADNGTVVYNATTGANLSALTWVDSTGKQLGQLGPPAIMANPSLSPDGTRVAVDVSDPAANNVDIWIENTHGTANARFTFEPPEEVAPVWSRDGSLLAYRSNLSNGTGLMLKRATGVERERQLFVSPTTDDVIPNSWSRDDGQILCTHQSQAGYHLEVIPAAGGKSTPLLNSKGNEAWGQISPDGKWVAYASDESGNWDVYVTTFPTATGKFQVSRGGGKEPRWRGDGKEIFYIASNGMLMAVPANIAGTFSTEMPAPLFQIHGRAAISSSDTYSYDVTKDGKRFLVNRYVKPSQVTPLTILLHATAQQ